MGEHLRESILHSIAGASALEALLRLWRIRAPGTRLRVRLFALGLCLLYVPLLEVVAPFRHGEAFAESSALFVGRRWAAAQLFGLGLDQLWLAGLGGLGLTLLLVDLAPWRWGWRRRPPHHPRAPAPPSLQACVVRLCRTIRCPTPALELLETQVPILYCRGLCRPTVVISRGALARLDAQELAAALSHELWHLAARDPWLLWGLTLARLLAPLNPVPHLLARAIALDAEHLADDRAAQTTGDRLALASALASVFRGAAHQPPHRRWLGAMDRARESVVEERCRRLMDSPPRPPWAHDPARLALAAAGTLLMLFFVT